MIIGPARNRAVCILYGIQSKLICSRIIGYGYRVSTLLVFSSLYRSFWRPAESGAYGLPAKRSRITRREDAPTPPAIIKKLSRYGSLWPGKATTAPSSSCDFSLMKPGKACKRIRARP